MGDVNKVKDILGCSLSDAHHYLDIFEGDEERTVQNVLTYGDDQAWWAHPHNSMEGMGMCYTVAEQSDELSAPSVSRKSTENNESKMTAVRGIFFLLARCLL